MEEFGDWIYILFIIIAAISSLVGSMRKKAQQAAGQNQPREVITTHSDEDDFWDIPAPQPKAEEQPAPKRTVPSSYVAAGKQKKTYQSIHPEGAPSLHWENQELGEPDEEYNLITVNELQNNTDEWRKAFIYNEIFNRKNER